MDDRRAVGGDLFLWGLVGRCNRGRDDGDVTLGIDPSPPSHHAKTYRDDIQVVGSGHCYGIFKRRSGFNYMETELSGDKKSTAHWTHKIVYSFKLLSRKSKNGTGRKPPLHELDPM